MIRQDTLSGRLAAAAVEMGLTVSEVRGDKAIRAVVTEKAGLVQRVRSDVWRTAAQLLGEESERAARGGAGSGRCKRCSEPVRWVTTVAGKNMPLNPLAHPHGNVILTAASGGKGTVARVVSNSSLPVIGAPAYRSHYASCLFADQFRRRRDAKSARADSKACPGVRPDTGRLCGEPMDVWLLENGYTIHPTCEES